jgi:amino acid adenylation domain-containing protein
MSFTFAHESSSARNEATDPPESDVYVFPTSFAQERLWFLDQLQPNNPTYNMQVPIHLPGRLSRVVVKQAVDEIVRRHEALRTTFTVIEGQPVQVISPTLSLELPIRDLRGLTGNELAAEVSRVAAQDGERPFDLSRGPLLRTTLLNLGEDEQLLLLTMHHIVSDGWSVGVLMREFATLIEAFQKGKPSPLPDLLVQYADFAVWQRQQLQGETVEAQLSYWKGQLDEVPAVLELPTDRPRPAVQTFHGAGYPFMLSGPLTEVLKRLCQHEGVTLFMALLAAFKALLYRYTGQETLIVGTPIAGRNRVELEGLIGFFTNTLVLCTSLAGTPTFRDLLGRVREVTLGAYAHQDLPFEKLVEELRPQRDLSHNPLVQVMLVLQNAPPPEGLARHSPESALQVGSGTAKFDLTLSVVETGQGIMAAFEYNTDLFDTATIERMVNHFQVLLRGAVENPDRRISELPMLTETERRQLLIGWNNTKVDLPQNRCAHQLFEAQVEQTPEAVAVVFKGEQLTYRELNQRANQLAHYLLQQEVGPEVCVGICLDRSVEMIVGILGVLKAGGAYLPLDPMSPSARLAFMLEDARVPVLLTQQRLRAVLPEGGAPQVVCLDTDWEAIAEESRENPVSGVTGNNLAYVIYTSGSTGSPKGVLLEHRGLCNLAQGLVQPFDIRPDSRVLQFAPLSFDASVAEVFPTLAAGATLCLGTEESLLPGPDLIGLLREQSITNVTLPPSVLAALPADELPALRTVVSAGEECSADLVARWGKGRRLVNAYGPTEATVCATAAECTDTGQKPTIGRPIANTQIYLLDQHRQLVPVGVPGELHIGGIGLARGYLNRPELTREKFIPNPFDNDAGARLYKSGDLARYRHDGSIEFLGRLDQQVKVRGYRIEPGEIEAALSQLPGIQDSTVLAEEDAFGGKRLVAYVIPSEDGWPVMGGLRESLQEKLPEYMVPSKLVALESWPLTRNGKVDRKALTEAYALQPGLESAYVAPRTEIERVLATVWQEVLEVEQVGVDDNFFDLGGHSLLMVRLHSKLREMFQREFSMVELFKYPTVGALADFLSQEEVKQTSLAQIHDRARRQIEAINRQKRLN